MEEQRAVILAARAQLLEREEFIAGNAFRKEREQEAVAGAVLEEAIGSLDRSRFNAGIR